MKEFERQDRVQPEQLPEGVTEEMATGLTDIADKLKNLGLSAVIAVIDPGGRHLTVVVGNRRQMGTLVARLAEQLPVGVRA